MYQRLMPVSALVSIAVASMTAVADEALQQAGDVAVPPFGASLEAEAGQGFTWSEGFRFTHLAAWPEPEHAVDAEPTVDVSRWRRGPYRNPAGARWAKQITAWVTEGVAAGLLQDTFRSFDEAHSSLRMSAYRNMRHLDPVKDFGAPAETVFEPRVTMGVQSYGIAGQSLIEVDSQGMLRGFYRLDGKVPAFQARFRQFYENNFLFAVPSVRSYAADADKFSFLSPFYLHAVGMSGSDAHLLRPLVLASAALPPDLKTRILRKGMFVPTLMYLFKQQIADGMTDPAAHVPAYTLPEESAFKYDGPSPFLDALLDAAHTLDRIPPVCRMRITNLDIQSEADVGIESPTYYEKNTYAFAGALKPGQSFDMTVDLRYSWTDGARPVTEYHAAVLRGEAELTPLNEAGSRLRVQIPWRLTNNESDLRTDILLLVHDGAYWSAPAYISVRHIHRLDPITLGSKKRQL